MSDDRKTIGIIGGMGPAATVDLFNKIVSNTDAKTDQEHIHVLIDCNSGVPDRTDAILNGGKSPLPMIQESAKRLEKAGADFLIIACNTSHFYLEEIQSAVSIPIISMIEESAKHIKQCGYKTAIILGTEGSRQTGIYKKVYDQYKIKAVYPDEKLQQEVTEIIYKGVKADSRSWNVIKINSLIKSIEDKNNALTVLACTELPIAVEKFGMKGNFVDPSLVLAKAAICYAGYTIKD